ncbi:hypothetical protein PsorP6_007054 [Peronosclerospora sorghi]|uniref:Uncharacterized protein n=1 Tax=Peronosclerospora sorghi TaxID=230839 RepID=A0ACC0WBD8_9STRA|nr:hypothetical protein PsorP6_007054 [Peronosclerospora sorghi]
MVALQSPSKPPQTATARVQATHEYLLQSAEVGRIKSVSTLVLFVLQRAYTGTIASEPHGDSHNLWLPRIVRAANLVD